MVEKKQYKTKICQLYQKGNCTRPSCWFAHGSAELRNFSGPFNELVSYDIAQTLVFHICVYKLAVFLSLGRKPNSSDSGRQDYHGTDLRNKIHRKYSPQRGYSPGRDITRKRGYIGHFSSRSLEKERERKQRNRQVNGLNDFSGSLKPSNEAGDLVAEQKLKQVETEITTLKDQKGQLEASLEERSQEIDSLASRIEELESQLYKEKEECKRLNSKIRKYVKAHNRHSKIQDELKRSQVRLQKLGDQLLSDAVAGINAEDSSINIVSDEEANGRHVMMAREGSYGHASPSRKRLRPNLDVAEEVRLAGNTRSKVGPVIEKARSERPSRWSVHPAQPREPANNLTMRIGREDKNKCNISVDPGLPSTGIAAHATDEEIDITDVEEKTEMVRPSTSGVEQGVEYRLTSLPLSLPPPPPLPTVPENVYQLYKGDEDERVDVEDVEDTLEIHV